MKAEEFRNWRTIEFFLFSLLKLCFHGPWNFENFKIFLCINWRKLKCSPIYKFINFKINFKFRLFSHVFDKQKKRNFTQKLKFCRKSKFCSKIPILVKNPNFGQKSKFSPKIETQKKSTFIPNFLPFNKIFIYIRNLDFSRSRILFCLISNFCNMIF